MSTDPAERSEPFYSRTPSKRSEAAADPSSRHKSCRGCSADQQFLFNSYHLRAPSRASIAVSASGLI